MLCPNCDLELKMSERQGVEIDYCPRCRGIWLDRGELDKIIERSASKIKSSKYDDRKYNDHKEYKYKKQYYKKKKRKSFLEDIFDVF